MISVVISDKCNYFSYLKDSGISEEEYQRANSVWNTFKMNTLGDYHDLYLKTDVLLLADVFEKFIRTCLNYYGLDPCHYFSAPGFSWDAMLKMTQVELQIISDIDVHLFIEKGMTGGISYIGKRHSKINDCESSKEKKSIIYWDANNLYRWGMSNLLPYDEKEIYKLDLDSISENSSIGYFLEVDLEYPSKLQDFHNNYPLASEKLEISSDMLSKYCSDIADNYGIKVGGVSKLVPNLRDKEKYIVHYRNLRFYLSLGIKLSKVHRVIKFKQSNWLKEHIDFNTEKKKNSRNSFERSFFKLLVNSIYGKCMENIRKRINVKLINSSKDYARYVSKPNFVSQKILSRDSVVVHQVKSVLTLDKPIYVGFSILELSKLLMNKFHYEYVKNKFDAKLLFTDTDSLVHEMKGEDVYEKSFQNKELFDFSNYPVNSKYYDPKNNAVLGKMKDEFKGKIIREFVGLKSKMYSSISADDEEVSKAKRANKKVKHKEFVGVLFNRKVVKHNMKIIQSKFKDVISLL